MDKRKEWFGVFICILVIATLFYIPKLKAPMIKDPIAVIPTQTNTGAIKIMKRSEAGEDAKWKLDDIFKNEKEIETSLQKAKETIETLASYKGKLSDEKKLLEYLKLTDAYQIESDKRYIYASL